MAAEIPLCVCPYYVLLFALTLNLLSLSLLLCLSFFSAKERKTICSLPKFPWLCTNDDDGIGFKLLLRSSSLSLSTSSSSSVHFSPSITLLTRQKKEEEGGGEYCNFFGLDCTPEKIDTNYVISSLFRVHVKT
jgi:hypothetical protein